MKRLISWLGGLLIAIGSCGILSVVIQYIVFRDMPPTLLSLICGSIIIAVGILICVFNKKHIKN